MPAKPINWENIAKRMIGLSAIGGTIDHFSGHRYIRFGSEAQGGYFDMYDECRKKKIQSPRMKQYGGVESCLDAVDEVLKKLGRQDLLSTYEGYAAMSFDPEYYADPNRLINGNEDEPVKDNKPPVSSRTMGRRGEHRWDDEFCTCGNQTCICQVCEKIVCSSFTEWHEGKGNICSHHS